MIAPVTLQDIEKAVSLGGHDGPYAQNKMAPITRLNRRPQNKPGDARLGGVLMLLFCLEGQIHLLLTRRREDLPSHAGQISFPGGRKEDGETLVETALRETYEEVGVRPDSLRVLGELTPLYIFPSDYVVHPFVAWHSNGDRPPFSPSPAEVAEIIETPLQHLLDPGTRREELWNIRGTEVMVPFFDVQGHKVWGATAMILSELLDRLHTAANRD